MALAKLGWVKVSMGFEETLRMTGNYCGCGEEDGRGKSFGFDVSAG